MPLPPLPCPICCLQYLFIFLKFVASVVPTIEYDYTMSVQTGMGRASGASASSR